MLTTVPTRRVLVFWIVRIRQIGEQLFEIPFNLGDVWQCLRELHFKVTPCTVYTPWVVNVGGVVPLYQLSVLCVPPEMNCSMKEIITFRISHTCNTHTPAKTFNLEAYSIISDTKYIPSASQNPELNLVQYSTEMNSSENRRKSAEIVVWRNYLPIFLYCTDGRLNVLLASWSNRDQTLCASL